MTFNHRQNEQPTQRVFSNTYHFEHLQSGLYLHGGRLDVSEDAVHYRLKQPYIAFVVLLFGGIRFALNKQSYEISSGNEGRCVLIATNKVALFSRYLSQGESVEKLTIAGVQRWLNDDYHLDKTVVRDWVLMPSHRAMAEKLLSADGSQLEKDALAMNMVSTCWTAYGEPLLGKSATEKGKLHQPFDEDKRIGLETAMLDAIENGALETTHIANHLNLSLRTLQRKVRAHCGCSINEWRQQVLMQKALVALGDQHLSIGEAAYLCGYKQSSNFIQAFRKYYGVTPGVLLSQ